MQHHQVDGLTLDLCQGFLYPGVEGCVHILPILVVGHALAQFHTGPGHAQPAQYLGANGDHLMPLQPLQQGFVTVVLPLYLQFSPSRQALTTILMGLSLPFGVLPRLYQPRPRCARVCRQINSRQVVSARACRSPSSLHSFLAPGLAVG